MPWARPLGSRRADGVLGYVPGAWDMFHIGHLNILKRARQQCERLVVGVVTDDALFQAKGKYPIVPLRERMQVVAAMNIVDAVVVDFSSSKLDVWDRVHFDVLFKGTDWQGTPKGDRLESEMASVGCRGALLPVHGAHLVNRPAADSRHSLTIVERARFPIGWAGRSHPCASVRAAPTDRQFSKEFQACPRATSTPFRTNPLPRPINGRPSASSAPMGCRQTMAVSKPPRRRSDCTCSAPAGE